MKVRHERPMPDLSFQVRAPLGLELATGEAVAIANWSLEGFEFPGDSDILPKEAVLSIPFQGVDIRFPVHLAAQPGTRFLAFDGLSGRQRETLAVFYRSILSGKMASTDDIITSLDTPVDLVPMEETESEKTSATAGNTPRALRAATTVIVYLAAAAFIFGTMGTGIYSRLATVDIQNARVEAPLVTHLAAEVGYVDEVLVAPGDVVAAGELLVRLATPESDAALAAVRGRIDLLEDRLEAALRRAANFDATLALKRTELVDAARLATGQGRIEAAAALEAFDGRYSDKHSALFAARAGVRREIDALEEELRRLRRERGRLRNAADALHLKASEPGTVTEMSVLDGQFITRGATVVQVEGTDARQVRGWVDASMAAAFYKGMTVTVTINEGAGAERLKGQIAELEAGVDLALSPQFGMLVTVSFPQLSAERTREKLPHLMPVQLEATRAWAVRLEERRSELSAQFKAFGFAGTRGWIARVGEYYTGLMSRIAE